MIKTKQWAFLRCKKHKEFSYECASLPGWSFWFPCKCLSEESVIDHYDIQYITGPRFFDKKWADEQIKLLNMEKNENIYSRSF